MKLDIHHIGMVVEDIDRYKDMYEGLFGFEEKGRYTVTAFNAECSFLLCNNTYLELIKPLAEDGLARFLKKHGSGKLHHICYVVANIDEAVRYFTKQKGLRCLSETPEDTPSFEKAIFLHPKDTGNLLIELVSGPSCPLPA
jgi:methylmalonyl-CoA/ethylmalonyl-CoA epimerase